VTTDKTQSVSRREVSVQRGFGRRLIEHPQTTIEGRAPREPTADGSQGIVGHETEGGKLAPRDS
jgi:hypothetical protein